MHSEFEKFSSRVIRLPMKDIDTDIIIPAQFLKITTKKGLGKNVFYNLRNKEIEGKIQEDPEFPMNKKEFANARIVVAGQNFGCGSSREHAPWALKDAGIDVIISSEFADIFKGNAEKNGILPLVLPEKDVQEILAFHPSTSEKGTDMISIDLEQQTVSLENGKIFSFTIEEFPKRRLLENISDLSYLLEFAPQIREFETKRKEYLSF